MAAATQLVKVPTLIEILSNPAKVAMLPIEAVPALRGELARLDTLLLSRLFSLDGAHFDVEAEGDRLLDVEAAAVKLGTTTDWLYRHADKLPFVVRVGKKQLRFSGAGIERYIHQRAGG